MPPHISARLLSSPGSLGVSPNQTSASRATHRVAGALDAGAVAASMNAVGLVLVLELRELLATQTSSSFFGSVSRI
jgi:hypothetical protein